MPSTLEISAKKSFLYGWELLKINWKKILPITIVTVIASYFLGIVNSILENPYLVTNKYGVKELIDMPTSLTVLTALLSVASILISIVLAYNYTKIYFKVIDKKEYKMKDLFMNLDDNFWSWIMADLSVALMVLSSLALALIPTILIVTYSMMGSGFASDISMFATAAILSIPFILLSIYLSIRFGYAPYLAIDKGMKFREALATSSKMTKNKIWSLIGFNIVLALYALAIILIGLICLIVGVLPAIFVISFVISISQIHLYRDLYNNVDVVKEVTQDAN